MLVGTIRLHDEDLREGLGRRGEGNIGQVPEMVVVMTVAPEIVGQRNTRAIPLAMQQIDADPLFEGGVRPQTLGNDDPLLHAVEGGTIRVGDTIERVVAAATV